MVSDYTPLAEPFTISFEKDSSEYEARVIYAKSAKSCANFFQVVVNKPEGIEPFCLKEKPVISSDGDSITWVDEDDKQSIFYQTIGNEIASQLKTKLGIYLLDFQASNNGEEGFSS
jgi:hypothetical protein